MGTTPFPGPEPGSGADRVTPARSSAGGGPTDPVLAVLTSGGDAPGMNAAVRAVAKLGAAAGRPVLGVELGYDGLREGRFVPLTRPVQGSPDGALVVTDAVDASGGQGGTLLGSARSARFRTPEGRAEAADRLRGLGALGGLVVVGGNGSLAGAHALATEHPDLPVIGVPASIDNDIGCTGTAIGVDTALNTIVDAVDRISDTARAHRRAFLIEVMGRECGYLAMASAVAAGADGALYREQGRSDEEIVADVEAAVRRAFASPSARNRFLLIKSEGVRYPCTKLVRVIEERVKGDLPDVGVRGVVLGHVVRGGRPSYQDRMIAGRLAYGAVAALADGRTDLMVGWGGSRESGEATPDPYVRRIPLPTVLEETRALLDGTSPVTRRRVKMMQSIEGAFGV